MLLGRSGCPVPGRSRPQSAERAGNFRDCTATALGFRDMAGARLSPAVARPQGGGLPNTGAVLHGRCCCGWGQPRSCVRQVPNLSG